MVDIKITDRQKKLYDQFREYSEKIGAEVDIMGHTDTTGQRMTATAYFGEGHNIPFVLQKVMKEHKDYEHDEEDENGMVFFSANIGFESGDTNTAVTYMGISGDGRVEPVTEITMEDEDTMKITAENGDVMTIKSDGSMTLDLKDGINTDDVLEKHPELKDAMERVERTKEQLMDEGYTLLAEELNQAHQSLQIHVEVLKEQERREKGQSRMMGMLGGV